MAGNPSQRVRLKLVRRRRRRSTRLSGMPIAALVEHISTSTRDPERERFRNAALHAWEQGTPRTLDTFERFLTFERKRVDKWLAREGRLGRNALKELNRSYYWGTSFSIIKYKHDSARINQLSAICDYFVALSRSIRLALETIRRYKKSKKVFGPEYIVRLVAGDTMLRELLESDYV